MGLPTVAVDNCSDGQPCQMLNYGRGCVGRCAIDQMTKNVQQLAAVVDRARGGSVPHQEILARAGIAYDQGGSRV